MFSKEFTRIVVSAIEHGLIMKIALRIIDLLEREESGGTYSAAVETHAEPHFVASVFVATGAQALAQTRGESSVSNVLEPTPAPQHLSSPFAGDALPVADSKPIGISHSFANSASRRDNASAFTRDADSGASGR